MSLWGAIKSVKSVGELRRMREVDKDQEKGERTRGEDVLIEGAEE